MLAKVHDRTKRVWGHDYTFTPIDGGKRGWMSGWGGDLRVGDYLILQNGAGTTRYRIVDLRWEGDPDDMWRAEVVFAPRGRI